MIAAKDNTSVLAPDNTQEKFNDNQLYFLFDEMSGNHDKFIDLYVNRDNDFNENHVGVKAYHFMNGRGCPTDGLKADYADIYAKKIVLVNGDQTVTVKPSELEVSLNTEDFYTKTEVDQDFVKTEDLSAVALSGDYEDLSNTPTLATVATTGSYDDLTDTPNVYTKDEVDQLIANLREELGGGGE